MASGIKIKFTKSGDSSLCHVLGTPTLRRNKLTLNDKLTYVPCE